MQVEISATYYITYDNLAFVAWLYDPKTNLMWTDENNKIPLSKDFFFINWQEPNDGVQAIFPKTNIYIYHSDDKTPQPGFVQIATYPTEELPYWFKNIEYLTNAEKEALSNAGHLNL